MMHQNATSQKNPIELGTVDWLRDINQAKTEATKSKKPIFILFQEVPGCSTCRNYGQQVMSHPLIKEAIETYFTPLCVHNNKSGRDRDALDFFKEPSWNNPVVRIVNTDLKDIVKRINGDYTSYAVVSNIIASMMSLQIKIPEYLTLLESELKSRALGTEIATIGMYCFWSGEKTYGKISGVVGTKAGFMGGSEVVEIEYCPSQIKLDQLIQTGKSSSCADRIFTNEKSTIAIEQKSKSQFKADKEIKYYLHHSAYKNIPMTSLQAAKSNSMLAEGKAIDHLFSPRQLALKSKSSNKKNYIGTDIITAWQEAEK